MRPQVGPIGDRLWIAGPKGDGAETLWALAIEIEFGAGEDLRPSCAECLDGCSADASDLERAILVRVADFRQNSGNAAAAIAISQFNRSFGFTLTAADRAAPLFTAIDAVTGGMSARRIGKTPLRPRFRRRVALALTAGGMMPEEADAQAAWLYWQDGGRQLRNALAHGDRNAIADRIGNDEILRLQAIVRALLPPFLDFAASWSGEPGASLTAAFNQTMTQQAPKCG